MSKIIKTAVFTFAELDDAAKETAREWYRRDALDYEWWDSVYDTAKTAGACLGIAIDDIYFLGFYSQGDGACFTGHYAYRKDWRAALKAEFGGALVEKLMPVGEALQAAQRPAFYRLCADVKHKGSGVCERSVDINVYDCEYPGREPATAGAIRYALRDFMCWIYVELEAEFEWLLSDECVDDLIQVNEYTFTADGRRFG